MERPRGQMFRCVNVDRGASHSAIVPRMLRRGQWHQSAEVLLTLARRSTPACGQGDSEAGALAVEVRGADGAAMFADDVMADTEPDPHAHRFLAGVMGIEQVGVIDLGQAGSAI